MTSRIGVPRALAYYAYYPWWKTFLTDLGFEVVLSPPTSRRILDAGVAQAVNDACIPIKVYHGHIMDLRDRVDMIFAPRLLSVRKLATETFCPKFRGLPDLVRASIAELPPLIDDSLDLAQGRLELRRASERLGENLGCESRLVARAYRRARTAFAVYQRLLVGGLTPPEALEALEVETGGAAALEARVGSSGPRTSRPGGPADGGDPAPPDSGSLRIAVLGYPYLVHDDFLSLGVVARLRKLGAHVMTSEMIPARNLRREASRMPKSLFWHFSNNVVGAASYLLAAGKVDGVVHVTAFACGPDAMAGKLLETAVRKNRKWFLPLIIDEHTGEGGVQTRLEAFVDMLELRRDAG